MTKVVRVFAASVLGCYAALVPVNATALEVKLSTTHYTEENSWSCGVQVVRMWVKFIKGTTPTENQVTAYTGGTGSSTNTPEMMAAMFNLTPNGYYFAQWGYKNRFEAVKGITWRLSKHGQPLAIAGQVPVNGTPGMHYYLLRGYKGTGAVGKDAYTGYPNFAVEGVYLEDTVYQSAYYAKPENWTRLGQYAKSPNVLITSGALTTNYWTPIGASVLNLWTGNKYRSVERDPTYTNQGKQLNNDTVRTSY